MTEAETESGSKLVQTTLAKLRDELMQGGEDSFRTTYVCGFLALHHGALLIDTAQADGTMGTVEWSRPSDEKEPLSEGLVFPLHCGAADVSAAQFTIGRSRATDIPVRRPKVSKSHAIIHRTGDGHYAIEDLDSLNGTKLNGAPIKPFVKMPLNSGELISFWDAVYVFLNVDDMVMSLHFG